MELPIEDVQTYPRPPLVESVPQRIRVVHADQVVADTTKALRVLETHHAPTYYLPFEDIKAQLSPVGGTSYCEWKGEATYFDLLVGKVRVPRAVWTYKRPANGFETLVDHGAIYASKVDACFVGDLRVEPQSGSFYGGWKTPNLRGTVKGGPGTEFW